MMSKLRLLLAPSPGTPGEGGGEGDSGNVERLSTIRITLILTFSRRTGRRDQKGRAILAFDSVRPLDSI